MGSPPIAHRRDTLRRRLGVVSGRTRLLQSVAFARAASEVVRSLEREEGNINRAIAMARVTVYAGMV